MNDHTDSDDNVSFREDQHFSPIIRVPIAILMVVVPILEISALRAIMLDPQPSRNAKIALAVLITVVGIALPLAVALLVLIAKLQTQVRLDGVFVRLFPLRIAFTRFAPDEITLHQPCTYRPIEHGGWGIRHGRMGKAYNARGNRGVQIHLTQGRKLLIGSQRPDELDQAIAAMIKAKLTQSR